MSSNMIKSADLKTTKKRQLILSTIEKSKSPLTAEDIYRKTINDIHMSVSTIYRALGLLAEKGVLLKNLSQDGKIYYQINNQSHKHTLVCTICNKSIPIDECPLEVFEEEIIKKTGYIITGHSLEFTGICPECAMKREKD